MQEYAGSVNPPTENEIRHFVRAARTQRTYLCTVMNGIGLIADPNPVGVEYIEQLKWTYEIVSNPETQPFFGRQDFYENLVPRLQASMLWLGRARNLEVLALPGNDGSKLGWLMKLVPISWCRWACHKSTAREVAALLTTSQSQNPLILAVIDSLSKTGRLEPAWYHDALTWFATKHD